MGFDTKIGLVVREDLAVWQKLNVTAFLAAAVAGGAPGMIGEPYEDGSGTRYLPTLDRPVLVFSAGADDLAAVRAKAAGRGLDVAVYTEEMFKTGNDEDNRAVVLAVAAEDLRLVGLAVHGPRNAVDKTLKGLRLHP